MKLIKDILLLIIVALLASVFSYFYWNLAQENGIQILILLLVVFLFEDNRKLKAEIKKIKKPHQD